MTPGTYVLLLRLPRTITLHIGRLGPHRLERGYYAYVGSALSGLEGRIRRHLRSDKTKRWHIDYLREVATVEGAWAHAGPEREECSLAGGLLRMPGAQPGPRGFGSSDCRCPTHLVYFRDRPPMARIERHWHLKPMAV